MGFEEKQIEKLLKTERERTAKLVISVVFREVYADIDWIRDRIHDGTFELKDWYNEVCKALKKTRTESFEQEKR